jgi:hypothetical protein
MKAGNYGYIQNFSNFANIPNGYSIKSVTLKGYSNSGYDYQLLPYYCSATDTLYFRCFYAVGANDITGSFTAFISKD